VGCAPIEGKDSRGLRSLDLFMNRAFPEPSSKPLNPTNPGPVSGILSRRVVGNWGSKHKFEVFI